MKKRGLLLLLMAMGCNSQLLTDLPTFPPIDDWVISATLRTDERQVKVFVSKPVTAPNTPIEPVRGLSVTLITNSLALTLRDTVIRSLTSAPEICYVLNGFQPQSGERYELRVQHKEKVVTGSTVIPERAKMIGATNRIVWTKTSAKFYRIFVSALGVASSDAFGFFRVTADTTVSIPRFGDTNGAPFANGVYIVRLESIDENLSQFMRNESLRAGLSAGYGVLGSISVQIDTLALERE